VTKEKPFVFASQPQKHLTKAIGKVAQTHQLLLFSLLKSLTESTMQANHCNGVNASDGMPCRRNQKLSPTGYCYQHLKQDPAYNEAEMLPNTPGPMFQLPPLQQQQRQENERRSSSIASGEQNSNNDEIERSHTDLSSSSAFAASVSAGGGGGSGSSVAADAVVPVTTTKGDLPRCTAIAKTTGQRCCKLVSFAGEIKCPRHGGKQIKLPSTLPMCGAISKTSRQPCLNRVHFAGQTRCAVHGGSTLRLAVASMTPQVHQQPATFTPPLKPQQHNMLREEYENPRGWAEIQAQSMKYLMETHPKSQCKCASTAQACSGMRIVMWAQALLQLAQQQQQQLETQQQPGSSSASIFDAKVSDLVKFIPTNMAGNDNKNLFSDLYLAVSMFGSNIFFLPRFYQHIQFEASGQPPFVPHLLRRTNADRESSSSGLEMEEERQEANDNGGRNPDVF
jgi:hypothetical protein